jgi:hypothetical protein
MSKQQLMQDWPKTMPKWNEKYPCPKEVTLYLSAVAMRQFKKDFPIPPFPNFKQIFKQYQDAQTK